MVHFQKRRPRIDNMQVWEIVIEVFQDGLPLWKIVYFIQIQMSSSMGNKVFHQFIQRMVGEPKMVKGGVKTL